MKIGVDSYQNCTVIRYFTMDDWTIPIICVLGNLLFIFSIRHVLNLYIISKKSISLKSAKYYSAFFLLLIALLSSTILIIISAKWKGIFFQYASLLDRDYIYFLLIKALAVFFRSRYFKTEECGKRDLTKYFIKLCNDQRVQPEIIEYDQSVIKFAAFETSFHVICSTYSIYNELYLIQD